MEKSDFWVDILIKDVLGYLVADAMNLFLLFSSPNLLLQCKSREPMNIPQTPKGYAKLPVFSLNSQLQRIHDIDRQNLIYLQVLEAPVCRCRTILRELLC